MNNRNIILNSKKEIIVESSPKIEHLEKLAKDCMIKGNSEACEWFKYYFYKDTCGVKCIYTNCWNTANLAYKEN